MNNKDNFEISQELKQMQEQFSILTRKVEEQNIVNDRIIRSCVKSKLKNFNRKAVLWPILSWVLLGGWLIYRQFDHGMPLWSSIFTICVCVIEVTLFLYKKHLQNKTLDFNGDIKEFSHQIKVLKTNLLRPVVLSHAIGYIWVIVWLWVFFSMFPVKDSFGIILLIIYVVAMTILNLQSEIKVMRILDEIVKDIEK